MGTILTFDRTGRLTSQSGKVARQVGAPSPIISHVLIVAQRGTTVAITGLFTPLPVRRKEFERHAKREFGKALHLLTAYALVPCTRENSGVVLTVSNTPDGGCVSFLHAWMWLTEELVSERRLRSSVQTVLRQFVPPSAHSGVQNSSRISSICVCHLR